MSILIKGMEMPKNCDNCWALDDYGDYPRCRITEEQRGYNFQIREKRMDKCPLVPVQPHGDLIDRDALEKDAQKRMLICIKNDNQFQKPYEIMRAIETAPTIIPAEEGE